MENESQTLNTDALRFNSLLQTAVDGIVLIDAKGHVLVFNRACEMMFGYQAQEVLGHNVKMLMPNRFAKDHDGFLQRYQATGERRIIGIGREVEGQRKDGSRFPLELSVGETQTQEGKQYVGILRDVSLKRDAEGQIDYLQSQLMHMARVSAMDEMCAVIAQELNQPLSAIMLYLQALRRSSQKDGAARLSEQELNMLDKAVNETSRAGAIIQRMRRFIERNDVEQKQLDLTALVDESVDFASMGSRLRNISLQVQHQKQPLNAFADAIEVSQVIVNLVRNAIDALHELPEGRICIKTYEDAEFAYMEVADNGAGIPPAILTKLFDAYVSSKKKGLGIGLFISRAIARKYKGDLTAHNSVEGGAVFILRLPQTGINPTEDIENEERNA
jgi:two-component system sensor kinase FixL